MRFGTVIALAGALGLAACATTGFDAGRDLVGEWSVQEIAPGSSTGRIIFDADGRVRLINQEGALLEVDWTSAGPDTLNMTDPETGESYDCVVAESEGVVLIDCADGANVIELSR
jgi:hypothetical protein